VRLAFKSFFFFSNSSSEGLNLVQLHYQLSLE
jgi:hypothetical protein